MIGHTVLIRGIERCTNQPIAVHGIVRGCIHRDGLIVRYIVEFIDGPDDGRLVHVDASVVINTQP